ncbi:hypothetical protein J4457_06665 [Candidatus Woesearchaeota archaeon]|nr:hypothetical protein [Candidatus Woesearchaeota archaeon]
MKQLVLMIIIGMILVSACQTPQTAQEEPKELKEEIIEEPEPVAEPVQEVPKVEEQPVEEVKEKPKQEPAQEKTVEAKPESRIEGVATQDELNALRKDFDAVDQELTKLDAEADIELDIVT